MSAATTGSGGAAGAGGDTVATDAPGGAVMSDPALAAALLPPSVAQPAGADQLPPRAVSFIEQSLACAALRFGKVTLKSGRVTPYYYDGGKFSTSRLLVVIGRNLADVIMENKVQFDVLFGPAFKGIPLATSTAIALATHYGMDVPVAYNRMSVKEFAEGGSLVGADMKGKRVLIVDDVVSGGDSVRASIDMITAEGGTLAGVVVALDRLEQSTTGSGRAPSVDIRATHGVPFLSIIDLNACTAFVKSYVPPGADVELGTGICTVEELLSEMQAYKVKYGS